MSGFVKCVDVAPGSDTTTFQIQAGINTYTLTSQKWVDWVAELPGRGKGKHGHFRLLIYSTRHNDWRLVFLIILYPYFTLKGLIFILEVKFQ